ncbi:Pentatricopeptide repeat-containing protein [Quillaja saponaria]|uniref:Pentatricopeptide repeat-containing protein n=1 Tax=Quillaja saponaria TaxID=32244 RepID=A0AAD7LPE5_QUISA|nr:Pentatricopeptide repeat-containing protein [Quillaja saponaria]
MAWQQQQRPLWSSVERKCLNLLQQSNTEHSLLQIHAFMLRNALETNVNLLTKFITTCASLALSDSMPYPLSIFHHGRRVFDHRLLRDDAFLCNSMIKAHVGMRQFTQSFTLYRDLRRETGFLPDEYTFTTLAKCCSLDVSVWQGEEIHTHAAKTGSCSNLYVSTALVDMYAKFGNMGSARKLFDEMTERSQVSWTALFVGYTRTGDMVNARKLFDQVPDKDSAAFNAMIDGYIKLGDMGSAHNLFYQMPEKNVISWTSMIYGYCYIGDIESARSVFSDMPEKSLSSWNAMIGGYCQNKQPQGALNLFRKMQSTTSLEPDKVTILSILPAIADLGALDLGGRIHKFVQRKNLDKVASISTALVDMYAKCGEIIKAKKLFDEMPQKETATWNALINGFAVNGCAKEALEIFSLMLRERLKPDEVTMMGVLSSCNHCGLVDEGRSWFKAMEEFGLTQQIEHYGCMVDLMGRAGRLEEAEKLITSMPYDANEIILSSFLFACGNFKDVKRAERVLKEAGKREQWNDGNYVMLRNLYATEQRWSDVEKVKGLMRNRGANKEVGCSVIEVDGIFKEFVAGDKLHLHVESIQLTLGQLWKHMNL